MGIESGGAVFRLIALDWVQVESGRNILTKLQTGLSTDPVQTAERRGYLRFVNNYEVGVSVKVIWSKRDF